MTAVVDPPGPRLEPPAADDPVDGEPDGQRAGPAVAVLDLDPPLRAPRRPRHALRTEPEPPATSVAPAPVAPAPPVDGGGPDAPSSTRPRHAAGGGVVAVTSTRPRHALTESGPAVPGRPAVDGPAPTGDRGSRPKHAPAEVAEGDIGDRRGGVPRHAAVVVTEHPAGAGQPADPGAPEDSGPADGAPTAAALSWTSWSARGDRLRERRALGQARHSPTGTRRLALADIEWLDLVIVEAVVVAAFLPYLVHVVNPGVFGLTSGLSTEFVGPWLGQHLGLPWIDPNVGYVSQALGHRAASDLLAGHVPWWNPYEGVGFPLAGEGQSAALFPLTPLLALSNGQVYFHLALELIGAAAMQRFLKEMGLARWVCVVGAILFGLNGTFAWLTNAAFNPVAFLPVVLWGIERCRRFSWRRTSTGWLLIAAGVALAVYAGFPETAYFELAFAACWAVVRLFQQRREVRGAYGASVGLGFSIGALVSAPFLVAFGAAAQGADIGGHAGEFAGSSLPSAAVNMLGVPYLYGPLFGYSDKAGTLNSLWGGVGGYITAATVVMAVFGLIAGRDRVLRAFLGGWLALTLAASFGILGLHGLLDHLPGVAQTALFRYVPPTWEMAAIVLACLGLQSAGQERTNRREVRVRLLLSAAATCAVVGGILLAGQHVLRQLSSTPGFNTFPEAAVAWALATVALLVVAGCLARPPMARFLMGLVLVVDALVMFMVPMLSAPTAIPVDLKPVAYLQHHLGLDRFVTLGAIAPNYGSYFGIAEVNSHDLPTPGAWAAYVHQHLNPNERPQQFDGASTLDPAGPSPVAELRAHLAAYQAIGVAYVVGPRLLGGVPGRLVWRDKYIAIYRLPHPTPFWTTASDSCTLTHATWTTVTATCRRPAVLVRDELDSAGWTASVDGAGATVSPSGPLFQEIHLPAGVSEVTFSFVPPNMAPAVGSLLVGLILGAWFIVLPARRRRRQQADLEALRRLQAVALPPPAGDHFITRAEADEDGSAGHSDLVGTGRSRP